MHNNITQAEDLAVLHDPSYLLASPPSVPAAFSLVGIVIVTQARTQAHTHTHTNAFLIYEM